MIIKSILFLNRFFSKCIINIGSSCSIAVMCAGAANGGLLLAVGRHMTHSDWLPTGNIATLHIARNEKWVVVKQLLAIVTKL